MSDERDRLLMIESTARALVAQLDRRVDPQHGLGAEFFHNNPEYRAFRRALRYTRETHI